MAVRVFLELMEHENVKDSSIIQEEPPDPTPIALMRTSDKYIQSLNQISISLTLLVSHVLGTMIMILLHLENIEKKLGLFKEYLGSNSCLRKEEYEKDNLIQNETCLFGISDSMTVLMHLLFAKCADNIAGRTKESPKLRDPSTSVFEKTGIGVIMVQTKKTTVDFRMIFEVGEKKLMLLRKEQVPTESIGTSLKRPRRTIKREEDKRFKPPDLDQDIHQDLNNFLLIKEAPPDSTYKSKMKPMIANHSQNINDNKTDLQGKYIISLSSKVTDLVPFIADELDLRSNPFQVGEDDVILPSTKDLKHEEGLEPVEQLEPELNGAKYGAKKQLVDMETKEEEEEALHSPLGSMTRSKTLRFKQALQQLLHSIQGKLECAYLATLVVIQVTQEFIKRGVVTCTLFPLVWFCPNGFSKQGF